MTGAELKTFAENVLDGVTIDDEFFYQLLNIAKTKHEAARLWQYLKKLNSANVASSTPISLSALADFAEDYKVMVGDNNEYRPIPFDDQHLYPNASGRYVIDWASESLQLLGSNIPSRTLYIYYKKFTPDITEATSPVFPARFHPLLAFYVAAYYQGGIDSDDIFARMAPVNRNAAIELENAMKQWDSSIAARAQDNRVGMEGSAGGSEYPIGLM